MFVMKLTQRSARKPGTWDNGGPVRRLNRRGRYLAATVWPLEEKTVYRPR